MSLSFSDYYPFSVVWGLEQCRQCLVISLKVAMCGVLLVDEQNFKRGRCRNRVANYRWGYQNPLSTMKRFTNNILHLLILSLYVTFVRKLFLPTIVLNISFIFHSKEKIMFRSLAFYVFHEFTHFKICDIVIDITSHQKLCFQLF